MDIERLVRISNTLATEKDKNEAIKFLALNVCSESLPAIIYISKITKYLQFEHFLSFGVNPKSLESTRKLEASAVPIFNRLITSDEILITPLNLEFFKNFGAIVFDYREGWKTVVVFSIQNTFLVTITLQVSMINSEEEQSYFHLVKALMAVYLNHVDENSNRHTHDRYGEELSPRQQEILEHLKAGLTNNAIAIRMGYSESLIKQETMTIYQKLGILGRKDISASTTPKFEVGEFGDAT